MGRERGGEGGKREEMVRVEGGRGGWEEEGRRDDGEGGRRKGRVGGGREKG